MPLEPTHEALRRIDFPLSLGMPPRILLIDDDPTLIGGTGRDVENPLAARSC
jgi:hypothetical protein